MRVLLIEDDPDVRALLVEGLGDAGFDVDGLANAEDAQVLLGAGQVPDVLIADVNLGGGLSGIDLADMARTKYPDVSIVLITGGGDSPAGPGPASHQALLRKPFSTQQLVDCIRGTKPITHAAG